MKQRTLVRTIVAVLVFVTTWWLFHLPAVANPFWIFCTTGVLPIVHRTLPPDAVMKLSIGLAVVGFMLVFRREIIASMPVSRRSDKLPYVNEARYGSQHMVTLPQTMQQIYPMPLRHPLARSRTRSKSLAGLQLTIGRFARMSWMAGGYAMSRTATAMRRVARVTFAAARRAGIVAVVAAVFAWRMVEPYCRMFDRWLDATIHRNKVAADILDILDESWKTARALYRKFDGRSRTVGSRR